MYPATWIALALRSISPGFSLPENQVQKAFTGIQTDSRKVKPGDLFVALAGDSFDGHRFIDSAVKAGASGVLFNPDQAPGLTRTSDVIWIPVPDTLGAYRKLAQTWRQRFRKLPLLAVMGAVGKTTTKELLAAALSGVAGQAAVLKTEGSQNGFVGIPMTLLELREHHKFAVIEVGIDEIGAMAQHLDVVGPTHTVVTAIGPEHLEKLRDLETVTEEECLALEWTARKDGVPLVHLDDPRISERWEKMLSAQVPSHHAIYAGMDSGLAPTSVSQGHPTYRGRVITGASGDSTLEVTEPDQARAVYPLPLPGAHNARNALLAIALARSAGASADAIARGFSQEFRSPFGRTEISTYPGVGAKLLFDAYNANPSSVTAALELARSLRGTAPHFHAVLGDMLELGPRELEFHRELLPSVVAAGVTHLWCFGPRMLELAVLGRQAHPELQVWSGTELEGLKSVLETSLSPKDFVLIKGSRGMKLERLVGRTKS